MLIFFSLPYICSGARLPFMIFLRHDNSVLCKEPCYLARQSQFIAESSSAYEMSSISYL